MLRVDDDSLGALRGQGIPSQYLRGVHYRVDRVLGEGGMGVALFALRVSPEGETPVVLKALRPSFVIGAGPTAALTVQKEAVALGRLNERVPPTPFVVRMLDAGTVAIDYRGQPLELPWLALEYVHGGAEGTTLTARVAHAVRTTRYAFSPERAGRAIESLALGVGAVHEMGVVHRDIKPDNILCCGSGESEIFKVSDFGLARPAGVVGTFAGLIIGTPGFAPPELTALDQRAHRNVDGRFRLRRRRLFHPHRRRVFPRADARRGARARARRIAPVDTRVRGAPSGSRGARGSVPRDRRGACASEHAALRGAHADGLAARGVALADLACRVAPAAHQHATR